MDKKTNKERDFFKVTLPMPIKLKGRERAERIRTSKKGFKQGIFITLLIFCLIAFFVVCKSLYYWVIALASFMSYFVKEIPLILLPETDKMVISLWLFATIFIVCYIGKFFALLADYLFHEIIKLVKKLS